MLKNIYIINDKLKTNIYIIAINVKNNTQD